jgi:hypothetical protein
MVKMMTGMMAESCPQCGGPLRGEGNRITCEFCGASLIRRQGTPDDTQSKWGVHLKAFSYVDQQGGGIEAFRMLIPKTWQFEGGVFWRMDNPGAPASIAFRTFNPEGRESFEVFPNISCYWTNQAMTLSLFPVGSLYFGNEVRPPAPVLDVLREMVIPRHRNPVAPWHVVKEEPLPDLPQQVRAHSPADVSAITSADGGRIRIQYAAGGLELEEEFFGVVEISRIAIPMMFGAVEHIYWSADYLFSFTALAGHLDRLADPFLSMVGSFRLNPAWYSRVVQVSQFMIQNQIQQIHQVGQLSRIISQTHDQISDMIMSSYQSRQETMDRISTQFSQTIRGVDEYHDPFKESGVELPGGYDYAWSNNLGEYIMTDDPNFNPNIETNLNWEMMKRR